MQPPQGEDADSLFSCHLARGCVAPEPAILMQLGCPWALGAGNKSLIHWGEGAGHGPLPFSCWDAGRGADRRCLSLFPHPAAAPTCADV